MRDLEKYHLDTIIWVWQGKIKTVKSLQSPELQLFLLLQVRDAMLFCFFDRQRKEGEGEAPKKDFCILLTLRSGKGRKYMFWSREDIKHYSWAGFMAPNGNPFTYTPQNAPTTKVTFTQSMEGGSGLVFPNATGLPAPRAGGHFLASCAEDKRQRSWPFQRCWDWAEVRARGCVVITMKHKNKQQCLPVLVPGIHEVLFKQWQFFE